MVVQRDGETVDAMRLRIAAFDVPLEYPARKGDEVELRVTAVVSGVSHNRYVSGRFVRLHHAKIQKSEIISTLGESLDDFSMSVAGDADDDRL